MKSKRGSAVSEIENCKVTLLGDSGVGKSSIIARYISGVFSNGIVTTAGVSYSQKIIEKDDNKLRLNIWDTAGQEKYRSLGKKYYKDAFIIVIVYDITSKDSFDAIKTTWYAEVKKFGEKYNILAIVGNKSDLYEDEKVSEDEAREYAKEIGANFFVVSACSGDGIDEMFCQLADIYLSAEFEAKKNELNVINRERKNSLTLKKSDLHQEKSKSGGCCA